MALQVLLTLRLLLGQDSAACVLGLAPLGSARHVKEEKHSSTKTYRDTQGMCPAFGVHHAIRVAGLQDCYFNRVCMCLRAHSL
jgi:hypothetical protein